MFLAQCTTETFAKADGRCACAFYLDRGLTWQQAAEQCYTRGARLPEIYSIEENTSIFNLTVSHELRIFEITMFNSLFSKGT